MNLNANNESSVPIMNDIWSNNKKIRNAKLQINRNVVWCQLLISGIIFLILLCGATLSIYNKTEFISWGGLTDRRSETKTINYDFYSSDWLACGIALLVSMSLSFLIFAAKYNRRIGVLESIGVALPFIGLFAMIVNAISLCYSDTDGLSYGGITSGTSESVGISFAYIIVIILTIAFIVIYASTMRAKITAPEVDEDQVFKEKELSIEEVPMTADDFFNNRSNN